MKRIIFACIITGLVFSFSGTSFAGSVNKHKKDKTHKKECCKRHMKKNMKKHGPPPHAPAHGYRHKHPDGVELEFNGDRGIYIVIDHDNHYYQGDHFFRGIDGAWKKSKNISGPWLDTQPDILPPGLPPLPPPPSKHGFWNFFGTKTE